MGRNPTAWYIYIKEGPDARGKFWWRDLGSDYATKEEADKAAAAWRREWPNHSYQVRAVRYSNPGRRSNPTFVVGERVHLPKEDKYGTITDVQWTAGGLFGGKKVSRVEVKEDGGAGKYLVKPGAIRSLNPGVII